MVRPLSLPQTCVWPAYLPYSEPQEWTSGGYDLKGDLRYCLRERRDPRLCHHLQPRFQLQLVRHTSQNPLNSQLTDPFSFGFKTLERSYLLRINGRVSERPQHMIMRVAVGIHGNDITRAIQTYNLMSERYFTHASPTLFNAGTPHPQLSSCFLVCMKEDSIEGIYDTLKNCAMISKTAGGIGLNIHCIRATGCLTALVSLTPE